MSYGSNRGTVYTISNSVPFEISIYNIYWTEEEYQDGSTGEESHWETWIIPAGATQSEESIYYSGWGFDGGEKPHSVTIQGKTYYTTPVVISYNNKEYIIEW